MKSTDVNLNRPRYFHESLCSCPAPSKLLPSVLVDTPVLLLAHPLLGVALSSCELLRRSGAALEKEPSLSSTTAIEDTVNDVARKATMHTDSCAFRG